MTRMCAAERRRVVLDAALVEFARGGYDRTPVTSIAERAGVSQPYLFKLFATKRELFLAAAEHCFNRWADLLARAAAGLAGPRAVGAMLGACTDSAMEGDLLAFPLKLYAAGHDAHIAEATRRHVTGLYHSIVQAAGVDDADTIRLLATVLLLQTTSAMYPGDPAVRRAVLGLTAPQDLPAVPFSDAVAGVEG
jgi:AcrR family transcriptional regulator